MSKGYTYLSESDDHYMIGHTKDGEFKVAKKGLSKALQKKIAALPRAMDEGGEVEVEDADKQEEVKKEAPWYGSLVPPFIGTEYSGPSAGKIKEVVSKADPMAYNLRRKKQENGNPDITNAAYVHRELTPDLNPELPGAPVQNQPQQATAEELPKKPSEMTKDYNEIINSQLEAGEAQKKQQEENEKLFQEHELINWALNDNHQNKMKEWQTKYDTAVKDYQDQKLNPHSVWDKAGTSGKIMAGIGLLLGGIGAGMTGGKNQALEIINKTIDDDIRAQQEEIGKKKNSLSLYLHEYGDMNAAFNAAKADRLAALEGQLRITAARTNSKVTEQNAIAAAGQFKLLRDQMGANQVATRTLAEIKSGKQPATRQIIEQIPDKDLHERAVDVPGTAIVQIAPNEKAAEEARKGTLEYAEFKKSLQNYKAFMQEYGTTLTPDLNEQAERLRTPVQVGWAKLNGVGKETPTDQREKIINQIPSPGAFRQGNVDTTISDLENTALDKLHANYQTNLPMYKTPKFRAKETVGRVK